APSEVNPALDAAFDDVLRRALARDVDARFATAREFRHALDAAFGGAQLSAEVAKTVPLAESPPAASAPPTLHITRKIDYTAIKRKNLEATIGATAAAAAAGRARILFVDDEERILSALKLLFDPFYEVHATTDAAQALEWLGQRRFHVLVS